MRSCVVYSVIFNKAAILRHVYSMSSNLGDQIYIQESGWKNNYYQIIRSKICRSEVSCRAVKISPPSSAVSSRKFSMPCVVTSAKVQCRQLKTLKDAQAFWVARTARCPCAKRKKVTVDVQAIMASGVKTLSIDGNGESWNPVAIWQSLPPQSRASRDWAGGLSPPRRAGAGDFAARG
jgi:hypothetical protein